MFQAYSSSEARGLHIRRLTEFCEEKSVLHPVSIYLFVMLSSTTCLVQIAEVIFSRLAELVARPAELARGREFTAKVRAVPPEF